MNPFGAGGIRLPRMPHLGRLRVPDFLHIPEGGAAASAGDSAASMSPVQLLAAAVAGGFVVFVFRMMVCGSRPRVTAGYRPPGSAAQPRGLLKIDACAADPSG
mmetsp:Transcript_77023/g.216096  ORF Transcript_77023/g.216096 Transcript_77023/m.216096 type:complete len:103 (-) Transcript_77023:55-363(-)